MGQAIRVGIAGCGKIGTSSHIPSFGGLAGFEITALADIVEQKAESARADLVPEAEVFDDFGAMVSSGKVDAVAICTPNDLHHSQAVAALDAGLHVLCEKPMAGTLAEATEMIEAADRAGRVLQINQSCRYVPLYATVAELVESGQIGKPLHARLIRAGGSTPDVSWSPGASWFVQRKRQGGIVLDIGIHMADVLRLCVGQVDSIAALCDTWKPGIDVADNISALMRFRNGATGVLELSWTLPAGANVLEVYGTEGNIRTGFIGGQIELIRKVDGETVIRQIAPHVKPGTSFESFLNAVQGKAASLTPGRYGWRALALCDAIMRSSESGQFETVCELAGD